MQTGIARDTLLGRRGRAQCPRCGAPVELGRMRAHLRDAHQMVSSDVETQLLTARRLARRSGRLTARR